MGFLQDPFDEGDTYALATGLFQDVHRFEFTVGGGVQLQADAAQWGVVFKGQPILDCLAIWGLGRDGVATVCGVCSAQKRVWMAMRSMMRGSLAVVS